MFRKTLLVLFTTVQLFAATVTLPQPPNRVEEWKRWEQQYDKQKIRMTGKMYTDSSTDFLAVPADYNELRDFEIAATPPTVDFGIIQGYKPWYLPVLYKDDYRSGGIWEGYGDVTRGPDGCFYFSIGNHRSYNGNAYIVCYDPKTKTHRLVVDLLKTMKSTPKDYADSKIHGDLDIDPHGDMWFLTYFGPFPTQEEWDTIYTGSYLFHYNIFTEKLENLGIPLEGSTWPYYNYDWKRGIFFAVAEQDGMVLAYDTKNRRILYAGAPKHGFTWNRRCTMLDKETGIFYSTDTVTWYEGERYRGEQYFISYTQRNNVFKKMQAKVPANPSSGKLSPIRSHTGNKTSDGAFWCFSDNGTFFKFWPAEDRTELIGTNWGREGYYTANMCLSPKRRFIYYFPGVGTRAMAFGTPVVQYDTKTGKKKVLGFLNRYYLEKYGYNVGAPYGLELDENGESIFFFVGGGFSEDKKNLLFVRPAMFQFHIPESERIE